MSDSILDNKETSTRSYIHIMPISNFFVVFDNKFVRRGSFKKMEEALNHASKIQQNNRAPIIIHKENGDVESMIVIKETKLLTNSETSRIYKRARPTTQKILSTING